jgi:hypothetical protein
MRGGHKQVLVVGLALMMIVSPWSGVAGLALAESPAPPTSSSASTVQSSGLVDVDASDLPGSGTVDDPYRISNVSELQAIEDDLDATYRLVSDITASGSGSPFAPIGNLSQPFTGTLVGDGHMIQDLTISEPNSIVNAGLFGVVSNGTIRGTTASNLTPTGTFRVGGLVGVATGDTTIQDVSASANIRDVSVSVGVLVGSAEDNTTIRDVSASGSVTGYNSAAGGVVGRAEDNTTIQNVSASTKVTGRISAGGLVGSAEDNTTMRNISASGSIDAARNVGGLVGFASVNTMVRKGSASGNVTGTDRVGGLVGANVGSIRNASATGTVTGGGSVGGLVGLHIGGASDTIAAGEVTANTTDGAGGLVGSLTVAGVNQSGTVSESYWDTQATGQATSASNATGLTTAEMQGEAARINMGGLEFGTAWRIQTNPDDYPELIGVPTPPDDDDGNDDDEHPPPAASAGPEQTVSENETVTLDATDSSDPDGDSLEYQWTQTGGPSVELTDSDTATPQFTAPAVDTNQTLTFAVTVSDPSGTTDTATTTVTTTVGDVETGPVARFDADDDGEISLSEVQAAIRAFSNGELDLQGVQQVIAAFSG